MSSRRRKSPVSLSSGPCRLQSLSLTAKSSSIAVLHARWFQRPASASPPGVFFWGADYHGCMEPADSIRRLGFARWYERRLIEGHAWFISGLACVVAIAACIEELSFHPSVAPLLVYVAVVLAAGALGVSGMFRHTATLIQAPTRADCARSA